MSDLDILTPSLQRFVAPPGLFATYFPTATADDMGGYLADGFAECQLRGFFSTHIVDLNTLGVLPDLTLPQGSLVVLFAGVRILQAEIRNRRSHSRQEANGLVNEVDYGASVLVELLKEYQAEKAKIIDDAGRAGSADVFLMADAYYVRQTVGLAGRSLDLGYVGSVGLGLSGF